MRCCLVNLECITQISDVGSRITTRIHSTTAWILREISGTCRIIKWIISCQKHLTNYINIHPTNNNSMYSILSIHINIVIWQLVSEKLLSLENPRNRKICIVLSSWEDQLGEVSKTNLRCFFHLWDWKIKVALAFSL